MPHPDLIFEYSEITPQVFIGTNQCCTMHFKEALLRRGVRADLSLEAKRIDAPFGVDYYLWLPVEDGATPTTGQFLSGVKFIDDLVTRGEKVYVHCEHGHGRAPTLVAAYFIYREHISPEDAFARIVRARPGAHPNEVQLAAVSEFSKTLRML